MMQNDFQKTDHIDQINAIFQNFMELYLYSTEAHICLDFDQDASKITNCVQNVPTYTAYFGTEYSLQGYELTEGCLSPSSFLKPSKNSFIHQHVLFLSSSGLLQKALDQAGQFSQFHIEPSVITIRCDFEIAGANDYGCYQNLKSVKLHGLSYISLFKNSQKYYESIKKHGELLDVLHHYFKVKEDNMDYEDLSNEIVVVLTSIDLIAERVSSRTLQLAYYAGSIQALMDAA